MTDNAKTPAEGTGTPSDNGDSAEGTAKQAPIMIPKARLDEEVQKRRAVEQELSAVADSLAEEVPEDFRSLIPNIGAAEKIRWIREAKTKGLFAGNAEEKPKVPSTDTKAPKTAPRDEDLSALPPQVRIARALGGGKK